MYRPAPAISVLAGRHGLTLYFFAGCLVTASLFLILDVRYIRKKHSVLYCPILITATGPPRVLKVAEISRWATNFRFVSSTRFMAQVSSTRFAGSIPLRTQSIRNDKNCAPSMKRSSYAPYWYSTRYLSCSLQAHRGPLGGGPSWPGF